MDADPHVARLRIFPIKSLDGADLERARLSAGAGALDGDREFVVVDEDGEYVNGKRTDAVHRIRARYADDLGAVELRIGDEGDWSRFDLPDDRETMASWFEAYYGYPVEVRRDDSTGFPDDTSIPGPTVISTGTIREVASWFPEIDPEGMRRRFRANVEIGGVPAFWEDRLYADEGEVVAFEVGDVVIEGVNPCQRCVVPTRDPDTGEVTDGFRERFVRNREETLPSWLESDRFDHSYRLMVNTRVPPDSRGKELAIGDPVAVDGRRPE